MAKNKNRLTKRKITEQTEILKSLNLCPDDIRGEFFDTHLNKWLKEHESLNENHRICHFHENKHTKKGKAVIKRFAFIPNYIESNNLTWKTSRKKYTSLQLKYEKVIPKELSLRTFAWNQPLT